MSRSRPFESVALLCIATSIASAQQAFKTPDEAAGALASAAKTVTVKAILTVLGPDGGDIVSSGDDVADAAARQKFIAAYDAKHRIAMEGDNKATLLIGPEDLPVPSLSCARTECGVSTQRRAATRSSLRRIGRTSWTPSRLARLCGCTARIRGEGSDRRRLLTHMPNASSANRVRRTASIGRHPKVKSQPPRRTHGPGNAQGYPQEGGALRFTATISRS